MMPDEDRKTVLLVEDSDDTRRIYSAFLQHHGYRVLEAANGREGIQLARAERPDIIVMNLSMPVIDGISATTLLREDATMATTPIIVCTAYVQEDGSELAYAAGCDAYLEKPVEPSRLQGEIERLVRKSVIAGLD